MDKPPNFHRPISLSPEHLEFLGKMETTSQRIIREYIEFTERHLIERLEILLGRVPSNDEVKAHCNCGIHPDGTREYQWKGDTFLRVGPIAPLSVEK